MKSGKRSNAWDDFDRAFAEGEEPGAASAAALVGSWQGRFLALRLGPGLSALALRLANSWRPWRGKVFETAFGGGGVVAGAAVGGSVGDGSVGDGSVGGGTNIVTPGFATLARLLWPLYRGYVRDASGLLRGFPFRAYPGEALATPGLRVLKIAYDLPANPRFLVPRALDELVQVGPGRCLGRAYFRLPDERWWLWGYFELARGE